MVSDEPEPVARNEAAVQENERRELSKHLERSRAERNFCRGRRFDSILFVGFSRGFIFRVEGNESCNGSIYMHQGSTELSEHQLLERFHVVIVRVRNQILVLFIADLKVQILRNFEFWFRPGFRVALLFVLVLELGNFLVACFLFIYFFLLFLLLFLILLSLFFSSTSSSS